MNSFRLKVIEFFNNKYVDWTLTICAWAAFAALPLTMFGLISTTTFFYCWIGFSIIIVIDRLFSKV